MNFEARAEREIELIEQDETLTPDEKRRARADVLQELNEALRGQSY
jgi:hypothetical protein